MIKKIISKSCFFFLYTSFFYVNSLNLYSFSLFFIKFKINKKTILNNFKNSKKKLEENIKKVNNKENK